MSVNSRIESWRSKQLQWNPAITDFKGLTIFFRLCRIPVLPFWLFSIAIERRITEELIVSMIQEDKAHPITTRLDTQLPKSRRGGQEPHFRLLDHLGRSEQPTNGRTKQGEKSHSMWLRIYIKSHNRLQWSWRFCVMKPFKLRSRFVHPSARPSIITLLVTKACSNCRKTRPDTRPIPVADGWVGTEMRVFTLSNSITTDRPTDRRTDGRTKPLIGASKKHGTFL